VTKPHQAIPTLLFSFIADWGSNKPSTASTREGITSIFVLTATVFYERMSSDQCVNVCSDADLALVAGGTDATENRFEWTEDVN
jgi:putative intracellular protease/amidase